METGPKWEDNTPLTFIKSDLKWSPYNRQHYVVVPLEN